MNAVQLIDFAGSDKRFIEAARMSTNKGFLGWRNDKKLLKFLWTNEHSTPFEFAWMAVQLEAPMFVFNQVVRHRTFSFNVFSQRYTAVSDDQFINALLWRKQGGSNKQGSVEGVSSSLRAYANKALKESNQRALNLYKELCGAGIAREQARVVLPQSVIVRWRMAGNARNWFHFLKLRCKSNAQEETRQLASLPVAAILKKKLPRTYALAAQEGWP